VRYATIGCQRHRTVARAIAEPFGELVVAGHWLAVDPGSTIAIEGDERALSGALHDLDAALGSRG
jgi:hypothetical protein